MAVMLGGDYNIVSHRRPSHGRDMHCSARTEGGIPRILITYCSHPGGGAACTILPRALCTALSHIVAFLEFAGLRIFAATPEPPTSPAALPMATPAPAARAAPLIAVPGAPSSVPNAAPPIAVCRLACPGRAE
jgi:hypothetical protein